MSLNLIHGPPNSGRAGLIRRRFATAQDRDPVLVVPTADDVFTFERELCEGGATLGGAVMTFAGLFRAVAGAGGAPPAPALSKVQRLRAISVAIEELRSRLGPLRRSASHAGFAFAFERLIDELQGAGLGPEAVEAAAGTLEGSAYMGDLATLFAGYAEVRDRLGRTDSHGIAREAISLLHGSAGPWAGRPVFLYGFDDLTPNQLDLVEALAERTEVTVALPFEAGNQALAARARLLEALRKRSEIGEETQTEADPGNTDSALLFGLERGFGSPTPSSLEPGAGLTLLRSAGERGEAEAIAAAVGRLLHSGAEEEGIAIALRDPPRRGPLLARVLESYGVAVALETELPVASTGVGGALLALLEAEHGTRHATDVLRWTRGPAGVGAGAADWLERSVRRRRAQTATEALELWLERNEKLPYDLLRLRAAEPGALAAEVGETARRMAARFVAAGEDGPPPGPGDGTELRAAARIASALGELGELAPAPAELIAFLRELSFRAWSGPTEGRVRIADPQRLRAWRFDHVLVGSLQDGEFPRHGGGDPFLSEGQREELGLEPRRDTDAEERYLFYVCLGLPRKSLALSYRDCDEDGTAEARSPLIDAVLRMFDRPSEGAGQDPVEGSLTRSRDLAQLVHRPDEAPSEDELARSVAAHSRGLDPAAPLDAAAAPEQARARIEARLAAARHAEAASREPGPLTNPAVIESLRAVPAYGGTTLEGFDVCSYRWFVDHELRPRQLDPVPDPLLQGGLMHAVLDRLYSEPPGDDPSPRPASLADWIARGRNLVAEAAAERELGERPAERAIRRSVEHLLIRFLEEEAERGAGAFSPWLLEAKFGEDEESEKPPLEIDGWRLHGAIDRADRAPDGRTLVQDYKVASRAPAARKLEEEARLQLQLYLLAVGEQWGATPSGALYHPLRATKDRRPRGLVLEDAAADLAGYDLVGTDVLPREEFEQMLEEARQRASRIVARMRAGEIARDPGPRQGLRNHDVCPSYCDFAPICRRDRAPVAEEEREPEEQ